MKSSPATHGTTVAALSLGPFHFTDAAYGSNTIVPPHEHALSGWTLTVAGAYAERFVHDSYDACQGAVLGKPAAARHSNRYGPRGARCFLIGVDSTDAALHRGVSKALQRVSFDTAGPAPLMLQRMHREFLARDYAWKLALEGLVLTFCAQVARLTTGKVTRVAPPWLQRVRDQLHASSGHIPTFALLAATAGVHPVHLSRAFRRAYGVTPGAYLRELRIERAKELLRQQQISIAQVAAAAGFCDQGHLTRIFRRATGTTPARYRRAH